MRNVLLACALVLGTSVGCSSSSPGEYASVGYRGGSYSVAGAAPVRDRARNDGTASRRFAARRRTTPGSTTNLAEPARSAAADAAGSRVEAAARATGAAQQP